MGANEDQPAGRKAHLCKTRGIEFASFDLGEILANPDDWLCLRGIESKTDGEACSGSGIGDARSEDLVHRSARKAPSEGSIELG